MSVNSIKLGTDSSWSLNENLLVFDQYYKKRIKSAMSTFETNLLSSMNQSIINYFLKSNKYNQNQNTFKLSTTQDLEDYLSLQDVKILRKCFYDAIRKKMNIIMSNPNFNNDLKKMKRAESLNKEEFMSAFSDIPFFSEYEVQFQHLFEKLDSRELGSVSWSDFCNNLMSRLREKDFYDSLKPFAFNNRLKVKHSSHNRREVTIKLLYLENPWRFINVSQRGSIGLWSKKLSLVKKFQMSEDTNIFIEDKNSRAKISVWLTDAVLLKECHRICVSTSKRNLRFFRISAEYLEEDFCIYGFENVPSCMDYYYDNKTNVGYLLVGDYIGHIHIFKFLNPTKSLYNEVYKSVRKLPEIHFENFDLHKEFFEYTCFDNIHKETVRAIKFISSNKTVISSSSESQNSIFISDPTQTKSNYIFSVPKGCACFDFNFTYRLLAAATNNLLIHVWNLYSPTKPVMVLKGHSGNIIGLKFYPQMGYLFSISADGVLKAWELKSEVCLQSLSLSFPISKNGELLDYGPNPICLYSDGEENGLLICYSDYVGLLPIGESYSEPDDIPISHDGPITCMLYCCHLKIVVICGENSKISFWDLSKDLKKIIVTGGKMNSIQNAHDGDEITSACIENRRLFTGARNGTIKAWNVLTGQLIQIFERTDDNEVTGLTVIEKQRILLSVGWSKKIATYTEINYEITNILKPKLFWHKDTQHKEDILCSDSYNSLLATGSYDGEINVWSIDTHTLFMCLRSVRIVSASSKSRIFHPVDQLLFLKHRASKFGYQASILISSEAGFINFWSFKGDRKSRNTGKFYSSAFVDQSVLSLVSDPENNILITGDTKGFIYIWDISDYKLSNDSIMDEPPMCLRSWRAHDAAISSIQYVVKSSSNCEQDLLLTASSDWCCRLWTLNGIYIGSFGQETRWDLMDPKSYQAYLNENTKNESHENEDEFEDNSEKILNVETEFLTTREEKNSSDSDSILNKENSGVFGSELALDQDRYNHLSKFKMFKQRALRERKNTFNQQQFKDANATKKSLKLIDNLRLYANGTPYVRLPIQEIESISKEDNLTRSFKEVEFKLPQITLRR